MGMKTVAIIGALDEEVALIAKSLTHVTHTAKGSLDIVSGTVDSFGSDVIKVAATVGGMGLVNAAATTATSTPTCTSTTWCSAAPCATSTLTCGS